MSISNEVIAQRLRDLRGGRTIKEASEALGISETSLIDYENGTRVPSDAVKIRIAQGYGTDVESLFFAY